MYSRRYQSGSFREFNTTALLGYGHLLISHAGRLCFKTFRFKIKFGEQDATYGRLYFFIAAQIAQIARPISIALIGWATLASVQQ